MGCPFVTLGAEVIKHDNLLSAKTRDLMERYCRYFEGALREADANREIQIDQPRIKARELYAYLIGSMVQARIRNDTGILRQLSAGVWPILRSSGAKGRLSLCLPKREQKPELSLTRHALRHRIPRIIYLTNSSNRPSRDASARRRGSVASPEFDRQQEALPCRNN